MIGADYSPPSQGESWGEGGWADEVYRYNSNGNRTNAGYVTGEYNRLLSDGTYSYGYDPEGNRTKRTEIATGAVTEYVWDRRNRLVEVIERAEEGGPVVQSVRYMYDSQNRWIGRVLDADGDGPSEAVVSYFVYDIGSPQPSLTPDPAASPGQMLLELDASGQVTHRYLWGPAVDQILADEQVFPLPLGEGQGEGLAAVQGGGQAGAPAERPNLTPAGTVLWPLTDHLNTVRDLARFNPDTDRTTVVNHLTYDAFGRTTGQSNPAVTTLFTFTGCPLDPATGLQNHLHRWYDPAVGRWLSEDPLGFAASGANLYRYCGNSATKSTDPTGLYWNWGNPFSGWMWNMWYYSEIDEERHQWILEHSRDPSHLADNLRAAQRPGPGETGTMTGLAAAAVQANATILGGAFVRPSAPVELRPYGAGGDTTFLQRALS